MATQIKIDAVKARLGLKESLPDIDQAGSRMSQPVAYTFVPPSHAKALDPDSSLIEGIRGSGKSFWWSALLSDQHRRFVTSAYPDAHLSSQVEIAQGFGDGAGSTSTPSKDAIAAIVRNYPPRAIWRAILAEKAKFGGSYSRVSSQKTVTWEKRVAWVHSHPEEFDELLAIEDQKLDHEGRHLVVVFDALDRLADSWDDIRPLARSLLQVGLDLRATRRVRFKMFVRPDMLEDKAIIGFPDASKLLARRTTLSWRRADLYALLFQCLANSPSGGKDFRDVVSRKFGIEFPRSGGHWIVPLALRADEEVQEKVFILLAGKAMSASPTGYKRGKPYSWLVNHLQDGRDQVSPRSFAEAVRQAAERTQDEFPDFQTPLHFSAIQAGVQAASQVRVDELVTEDYPWVAALMKPLKGNLTVPCAPRDVAQAWKKSRVLEELKASLRSKQAPVKLPPQRMEEGPEGVLTDLQELGVVQRLSDGRVQMPDVYRIAFGLGRRGGVKPLK